MKTLYPRAFQTGQNHLIYYDFTTVEEYLGCTDDAFISQYVSAGSTDLGDISHIVPCMHIWTGGISGALHASDFKVVDREASFILPAKMMAMTVIDLLENGAAKAWEIKRSCVHHTADEYQNVWSELLKQNEVNMDAD